MSAAPTILIAARDEEARIGETIAALRRELPGATVIVADDGSRDRTAAVAEQAGARVVRFPRRGKGQALTLAEREAPAGPSCSVTRTCTEHWRLCSRRARI